MYNIHDSARGRGRIIRCRRHAPAAIGVVSVLDVPSCMRESSGMCIMRYGIGRKPRFRIYIFRLRYLMLSCDDGKGVIKGSRVSGHIIAVSWLIERILVCISLFSFFILISVNRDLFLPCTHLRIYPYPFYAAYFRDTCRYILTYKPSRYFPAYYMQLKFCKVLYTIYYVHSSHILSFHLGLIVSLTCKSDPTCAGLRRLRLFHTSGNTNGNSRSLLAFLVASLFFRTLCPYVRLRQLLSHASPSSPRHSAANATTPTTPSSPPHLHPWVLEYHICRSMFDRSVVR